jgi:hypothetical protein
MEETFSGRWQHNKRLVLVSPFLRHGKDLCCGSNTIVNSYARSDDVRTMWDFNQALVEGYTPLAHRLYKYGAVLLQWDIGHESMS